MPTNLTSAQIRDTYSQLLHIDEGPAATEKTVHSGTGVATALRLGTGSASVDNIKIDGNTISSLDTNGNINLVPNGTGSVVIPVLAGDSLSTVNPAAHLDIVGTGVTADGTDANISITLTPKNTGTVNITNVNIISGSVPLEVVSGASFASFSDVGRTQAGSTTVATPVMFNTTEVAGTGITMVTDGVNLTRMTFAIGGTYMVMPYLRFANADSVDHNAAIWLAVNNVNVARSATKIITPKIGDGGTAVFQYVFYVVVTSGQYLQVMWLPSNSSFVSLNHTGAAGPPAVPVIPSAFICARRIA